MLNDMIRPVSVAAVAGAKCVGLLAGVVIVFISPPPDPSAGKMLAVGMVAWYVTLGAMVAVSSAYKRYPVVNVRIYWWLRGIMLGSWMNFVLALIASDAALHVSAAAELLGGSLKSPIWLVIDGAAVGLIVASVVEKIDRRR